MSDEVIKPEPARWSVRRWVVDPGSFMGELHVFEDEEEANQFAKANQSEVRELTYHYRSR